MRFNCRGQYCFTEDVLIGAVRKGREGRRRSWGRGGGDGVMLQEERGASSCHDCHV